jgi:tetratricopeptide (TPR) repeat protein
LSPRYFLRRLSSHPLASGDAPSLLLSIGHQLAVLRPTMMRVDLDVRVTQNVGQVEGRVVGVRVGVLHISPFQHTAVQVEQHAGDVTGSVTGLEIDRMVADPRLNDLGTLQNLALLEPALRLAAEDPDGLVVVLIDALDELRYQYAGRGDILEWLAECPELPPNLRIVVSCRPDRQLLQRFRLKQAERLREVTIEPLATHVTADLVEYVERVLTDPLLAGIAVNPRRIAEHAHGSFLYLVLWGRGLHEAVEAGDSAQIAALTDLAVLPNGLDGIYEYFLAAIRDGVRGREGQTWTRVWRRVYRRLLGVLAVARASVDEDLLLLLGDLSDERDDVFDALTDMDQFLVEDEHGIRLCHQTLAEFLTDGLRTRDDWHVDAGRTHHQVAEMLVSEYGGSWSACDNEYALSHTAAHLVAAVRGGSKRSPALLTDLLGEPDFGVAKGMQIGVGAMLGDYVAAHTTAHTELADGLAEALAQLVHHGVPNVSDTLNAVVGYRNDAKDLYRQVLNRLSDPAYLVRFISDDTARAAALMAFSHSEAGRLRRAGELDEAHRILVRAVSKGADIDPKQRSTLCYELGYIDFLRGDHEQAAEWFQRSIDAAEEAGEQTSAYISRLVALRVALLSGAVSPEDYRSAHEDALAYFTSPETSGPHVSRWVMTVHGQLLDLGLWTEDPELIAAGLGALEEDPWIRENGREDLVLRQRARAATVTGDWAEACALFESQLAGRPDNDAELARDLYYHGRALAGAGDLAQAREVWERGLRCPDNAANWPWKPRIAEALQSTME